MAEISDRIKEGMALRGFKQTDLVEKTGIGKSSISTYLKGEYQPKQRNIYKIAKALNVNEAWLMGYDVSIDGKAENVSGVLKFETEEEKLLFEKFYLLNENGKKEAIKQIDNLTYIPKYTTLGKAALIELKPQAKEDPCAVIAAHNDNTDPEQLGLMLEDAEALKEAAKIIRGKKNENL